MQIMKLRNIIRLVFCWYVSDLSRLVNLLAHVQESELHIKVMPLTIYPLLP